MNKSQIEYACSRIDGIANRKVFAFTASQPAEQVKAMEFDEMYALIASGKAKLLPRNKVGRHTDIHLAYTYPADHKAVAADKERTKKIDAFSEKVYKKATEIKDKFVFSDMKDAGQLVAEFDAMKI